MWYIRHQAAQYVGHRAAQLVGHQAIQHAGHQAFGISTTIPSCALSDCIRRIQ